MNTSEVNKGTEQRRYPRNHLMLEVEGRATSEEVSDTALEFHGYTTDVSLRGLCISMDQNPRISIGQQLKVKIQLFQDERPIEAVGRMCWLKEPDPPRQEQPTQIGLELLGVANSTRGYERWIERICWNSSTSIHSMCEGKHSRHN